MKRFIAVLLVMGVIMTAFATSSGSAGSVNITNSDTDAASTDVVLNLNQNAGKVWFSAATDDNVRRYNLTLPTDDKLNQSISGNDNWSATGNDLYLNWNIISKDSVQISLEISSPMVGDSASNTDKLGWTVSWYPTTTTNPIESSPVTISKASTDSDGVNSKVAYTKNGTIYGNAAQKQLWIYTENTFGKTADTYRAVLKATVKTT